MLIGVLANLQHSVFSSGTVNTSLAVAELFRELGHTVELVHCDGSESDWWVDCKDLQGQWTVRTLSSIDLTSAEKPYDILFEIGILQFPPEVRKKAAMHTIWIIRSPYLLKEIEECVYPKELTAHRSFEGISESWILDAVATEDYDVQMVELLTRAPVRKVPYIWTPSIAKSHLQSLGNPTWLASSIDAIKQSRLTQNKMPPWTVHIAETN